MASRRRPFRQIIEFIGAQFGAIGDDVAHLLHTLEGFLGVYFVAVVEHALVLVRPLLGGVVCGACPQPGA